MGKFNARSKIIARAFISFGILLAVLSLMFFVFRQTGLFEKFYSDEGAREFVNQFTNSWFGYLFYMVFYIAIEFSMILPLSALVASMAVVADPHITMLVSMVANIFSATVLYLIGRYGATKLLIWIAGDEEILDKWQAVMRKNKYTLSLMLLFPFSPNQLILTLCGSGRMRIRSFAFLVLFIQGAGIAFTIYGARLLTYLEPLWLWLPLSIILVIVAMILAFKNQDKIDNVISKLVKKK